MSGVELGEGLRASELLFEVLDRVRQRHPETFEGLRWPRDAQAFKKVYATTLIAFERRRLASAMRAEIARAIAETSQASMVFAEEGGATTGLAEYLETAADPLPTQTVTFDQTAGLVPELTFRGTHHRGEAVAALADDWLSRRWMTESAHRGIRWSLDQAKHAGRAEMVGKKVVSLGGGAELSPTRAVLRAGADVLYIDTRPPGDEILKDPRVSGTLTWVPEGANLLEQPREIAATIAAFADGDPVDVGMYAYSGGAAQEWRLTASMNAIVRSLPAGMVRSVVLLVSPTTPGTVSVADADAADERRRGWWSRPLGLRGGDGQSGALPARVSHSIVSLQGAAYQAAQYVGKMMAAEAFAAFGLHDEEHLVVSAPVAPITKTASLQHPLFDVAFEGADLFDILVSEPQATRVMCALLAFHDLLNPEAPSRRSDLAPADRAAAIAGEQIHGGVYAQGYDFERVIGTAAVGALVRNPRMVPSVVRFALG